MNQSLADRPGRAENSYTPFRFACHFITAFKCIFGLILSIHIFVGIFVLTASSLPLYSRGPARLGVREACAGSLYERKRMVGGGDGDVKKCPRDNSTFAPIIVENPWWLAPPGMRQACGQGAGLYIFLS
jgi:hypothetical protein